MKSPDQGPVMYVNFKTERFLFSDNRRGIRFFLIDSTGKSQLAVLGEERDTRDGHYMYRKQASFPAGSDLCCGNLAGVHKWVREVMIESGCKEITIDFKPIRRGSALGGAAEASHHKKQRHLKEEIERLVSKARENECSNLNVYASGIRSARSAANAWLNDAGTSTSAFERALGEASQAKASEESILKSLRDLCDLYAPMHLLDSTDACVVISALERNHPSRAVKNLCSQVRDIWRLQLEKSMIVGAAPWDDYPILYRTNLKPVKPISKGTKSGIGKTGVGGKGGSGKTGIGKGRKICHHCNQIVGSPSRVCPFCKGELPLKVNPKAA